ncbi:major facilitator superfamily domain-containing protein [Globomyces pollinis-pini]|nr:major facilitator superfamily domain-containing protein [Globomyces pollinis-pini]
MVETISITCLVEDRDKSIEQKLLEQVEMEYPEGGFGWVVVLASFFIHMITIGLPGSFGVFHEIYTTNHHFNGTNSQVAVAFIGSFGTGGIGLLAIPSVMLVNRLGHRFICISGGICIIISHLLAAEATELFLMLSFSMFGYFIPFFFVPAYAVQNGMTDSEGALLIGYMQGASAVGRILLGFIADRLGHVNILTFSLSVGAISGLFIWPFSTTYLTLTLFSVVYGFFVGGLISLLPSAIVELFGSQRSGAVISMVYTAFIFGDIIGAPVAGAILHSMSKLNSLGILEYNYLPIMLLTGGAILVGTLFMLSIKLSTTKDRYLKYNI